MMSSLPAAPLPHLQSSRVRAHSQADAGGYNSNASPGRTSTTRKSTPNLAEPITLDQLTQNISQLSPAEAAAAAGGATAPGFYTNGHRVAVPWAVGSLSFIAGLGVLALALGSIFAPEYIIQARVGDVVWP